MTLNGVLWMEDGACRQLRPPVLFFPDSTDLAGVQAAKAACETCPVRERCLQHALDLRIDYGVWGGASEDERRQLLRRGTAQRTMF